MKKFFGFISAKRILLALVFTITLAGFYSYSVDTANANQILVPCGVTNQQCIDYLLAHGYRNVSVIEVYGCDRYCDTWNAYNTTVFVSNGIITGYEDDPH